MIADLVTGRVSGKGVDGYREALELLARELGVDPPERHELVRGPGAALARLLDERELDLLLVTNLVNVRYLCGFTGHERRLPGRTERAALRHRLPLRRARRAGGARLRARAGESRTCSGTSPSCVEARAASGAAARLRRRPPHRGAAREALRSFCPTSASSWCRPAGSSRSCGRSRTRASSPRSAQAAEIADELYRWLIDDHGLAGHTERDVARALERRAQDIGAEAVSFPPIVAAATNGALPHADPGDVEIPRESLVVVDFGCLVDGYCSDCTRTFATGDDRRRGARGLRARPLGAGRRASRRSERAPSVEAVDAAARDTIEAARPGRQFGHGLGHGVGLEVHEAPRLAPSAEAASRAGNVVTVEPGVYVPGRFGVRIEDLVVVTEDGSRS